MDSLTGAAYLIPSMLILFWVGFAISQAVTKVKLSPKYTMISFGISWAVSFMPGLWFGMAVYEKLSEFIIVPVVSFFVTYIIRIKAKNNELDQYVELKNNQSQEIKKIKVGFDWPCFLFSFFFGIPLFLRKLNIWGGLVAGIDILYIILNTSESLKARNAAFIIFLSIVGLSLFLGFKANEFTAKYLIETGWVINANEDSNEALAKSKWSLK